MSSSPIVFPCTGAIQRYAIAHTGYYVIEAAGAQGGAGGGPGGKGARVKGTFHLTRGEIVWIVVGRQGGAGITPHQPAGGGGGGTFVWKSMADLILPAQPMLAAGGGGGGNGSDAVVTMEAASGAAAGGRHGRGGAADTVDFHYSGGGGAGWITNGGTGSTPTYCGGGSRWAGGAGANYCCNEGGTGGFGGGGGGAFIGQGSGGGGGYSGGGGGTQNGPGGGGGGSYNAGTHQTNTPGIQTGHGYVSLLAVPDLAPLRLQNRTPDSASPVARPRSLETAGEKSHGRNNDRGQFAGYF